MTPDYVLVQPYVVTHPDSSDPQDDYRWGHTVKADGLNEESLYWSSEGDKVAQWLLGLEYKKVADLMNRHFSTSIDGIYRRNAVPFMGESHCHGSRCDEQVVVLIGNDPQLATVHHVHTVLEDGKEDMLFGFVHLKRAESGLPYRVSVMRPGDSADWQEYEGFGVL